MKFSNARYVSLHVGLSLAFVAAAATTLWSTSQAAQAADGDSTQTVECMLPGQIRNIDGHATMGARHPEQLAPADCRERGGEYTESEHASQPMPVPHVAVATPEDARIVSCMLPRQPRRLGEKARYTTARHSVRITNADCRDRGGDVIVPRSVHHVAHKK